MKDVRGIALTIVNASMTLVLSACMAVLTWSWYTTEFVPERGKLFFTLAASIAWLCAVPVMHEHAVYVKERRK